MLGGCVFSTKYTMLADVYKKVRTNSNAGQIINKWVYDKTVACVASSFTSSSYNAQGTNEFFKADYIINTWVKLKTKLPISRSAQITNIRDVTTGSIFYSEIELKDSPATWFNVNGSSPVFLMDSVLEYETLLQRASEQGEIAT